jgi:hypothetical protein
VGVLTGADFRDGTTLELRSILDANRSGGAASQPVIKPASASAKHR